MITISVANQKGGVGKSTSCVGIAQNLIKDGFSVLLIDADWQQNLTALVGGDRVGSGIYDVITDDISIDKCLQSISTTLYLLPGGKDLKEIETKYIGKPKIYKRVLENVKDYFDYCIIDCNPYLGASALNALVASDYCIVPLQADLFGIQGASGVLDFIGDVKKRYNHKLKVGGLLPTMYEPKSTTQPVFYILLREQAEKIGVNVFTPVRKSQAIRTAQGKGDISVFVGNGFPGKDYAAVTYELLKLIKEM